MTIKQLIEILKTMPQDKELWHIWDGAPRSKIDHVYISKGGNVMSIEVGEAIYSDDDRPVGAPSELEKVIFYFK